MNIIRLKNKTCAFINKTQTPKKLYRQSDHISPFLWPLSLSLKHRSALLGEYLRFSKETNLLTFYVDSLC